ncbi:MAG: DUF4388 domain-containing protein [Desulfobacterales bacterium]
MSIKGTLETFDLSSLLQMLTSEKKTGRLTIRSDTNQVQIFFRQGDLVFATEKNKSNRIGQLLLNNGLVSRQALDTCLDLSREKKQFIGKTLVENGYLTQAELNAFLLKQAENSIYNVFLWKNAAFAYKDSEIDTRAMAGRKFNTMNILLEASRRIDELEVLKKKIPDDKAVLKCTGRKEKDRKAKLSADEKRVLSLINGYATVGQVLDQTGWDSFSGYKAIYSLVSCGLAEIVSSLPPEELASRAVSQLQGIDGRQFRETLDNMGIKRSSILRVALVRLFRDAADKNQLLDSVRQEAGKVISGLDSAELDRLRHETSQPFIRVMLELLLHEAIDGSA